MTISTPEALNFHIFYITNNLIMRSFSTGNSELWYFFDTNQIIHIYAMLSDYKFMQENYFEHAVLLFIDNLSLIFVTVEISDL